MRQACSTRKWAKRSRGSEKAKKGATMTVAPNREFVVRTDQRNPTERSSLPSIPLQSVQLCRYHRAPRGFRRNEPRRSASFHPCLSHVGKAFDITVKCNADNLQVPVNNGASGVAADDVVR